MNRNKTTSFLSNVSKMPGCRLFLLLLLMLSGIFNTRAQPLTVEWQRGYNAYYLWNGGETICATTDGGFIMAGYANTVTNWGADMWIVKLDESGNVVWEKSFAGNNADVAKSILQTADGGYIVLGQTSSSNADAMDNHGNSDIWVIRLDAAGTLIWKKCYGGQSFEIPGGIVSHGDGTYTIAATSSSNDGDLAGVPLPATNIVGWPTSYNVWLFRINSSGNIIWQKVYGGPWYEYGNDIKLMADGGYLVTGTTTSEGGDVVGSHGPGPYNPADIWVFRTDAAGNLLWQKCLGGFQADEGNASIVTSDGGIAVVGKVFSSDGDVIGQHGGGWADAWLAKLDASGNLLWQQCIGGSTPDDGMNVIEYEGKLIVSAVTSSPDGNVIPRVGGATDLLLAACDMNGTLLWTKCYGGSKRDGIITSNIDVNTIGLTIADDGGLAMIGHTTSPEIPYVTNEVWSTCVFKFKPEFCDTVSIKKDTLICSDETWSLTLSVPELPGKYLWSTGATTNSISVSNAGSYWCAYGKCPKRIDTFKVGYKADLLMPDLGDSLFRCTNNVISIGKNIPDVTYLWNTGEKDCCIVPRHTGMYHLTISNGCKSLQDSVFVEVSDCSNCLFTPNAFSPNGDGLNDWFGIVPYCEINNFKLNIFNRWGELVFTSLDVNQAWDGKFKGMEMPAGTYFYNIIYQNKEHKLIDKKGDLHLVR